MRQNLSIGLQQNPVSGVKKAIQKCHLRNQVVKNQLVIEFYKICKENFEVTSDFWGTTLLSTLTSLLWHVGGHLGVFITGKLSSSCHFGLCCSCWSQHTFPSLISVFILPMILSLIWSSNDLVEQSCIRDWNLIIISMLHFMNFVVIINNNCICSEVTYDMNI